MSLRYLVSALLVASTTAQYGSGSYGGGSYGSGGAGSGSWGSSSTAMASTSTASAQTASSTGSGELIVQVVSVSDTNSSLKYFPDSIQAPIGSIVQFQFHPKNHTLTESSFAEPCKPAAANLSTELRPGLKSGFVPLTGAESETPVFNVLINDTKPIWIYCGQTNHCQKGMSMVINQNLSSTDKTLAAYQAAAAQLPLVVANTTTSTTTSSVAVAPATTVLSSSTTTSTTSAFVAPTESAATSVASIIASSVTPASFSTTSGTAPATFTGAASRPVADAYGAGSVAGLILAGVAALL